MARTALEPVDYPFFDYRRFTFSLGIAETSGVWLSGSTAVRHDGARGMIVEGDLVAQARVIFDKMQVTLGAAGLTLASIHRIVRYLTPAALPDLPRLDAVTAEILGDVLGDVSGDILGDILGEAAPMITTIVVKSLLRGEALIEIEAVASRDGSRGAMHLPSVTGVDLDMAWRRADGILHARELERSDIARAIELVTPAAADRAGEAGDGFHRAIRVVMPRVVDDGAGAQIEIAGSRAGDRRILMFTATGNPAAGDVVGQCRDIYERIGGMLRDVGSSLESVVKTTEFVTATGLPAYRKTAEVRRETFAPPYPAATGVVCERLGVAGAELAVEAVAVMGTR